MRFAVLTGLYVAIVCTAQVSANKIVVIPWIHSSVPGGTYLIGIALATIELAHYSAPSRREGFRHAQVMIALGFAMLNLCIDLLYAAIDPRVRTGMVSARGRS